MTAFYMTTAPRELKREPSDLERERGRRYAAWLRAAMRAKGWNKARLAVASGVSPTYLGILENDGVEKSTGEMRRASEKVVAKIAEALEADEDAGRLAAGYASRKVRERPLHYVTDPDTARLVELYEGTPPAGKQMILSAAELAEQMSREGAIGGKRADDDSNPAEPE